jgi:hypothetical protein
MKLLLDQGLPRSSAAILREAGFDAVHAGEISLATAETRSDRLESEITLGVGGRVLVRIYWRKTL